MAAPDLTLTRSGEQAGGASDAFELFLTTYSGEVLTAFRRRTATDGRFMERTISSGHQAQFPVLGRTSAAYHTPGSYLTGAQSVPHGQRLIKIDNILLSDIAVAEFDELLNHYDVRGEYAMQQGEALAIQKDSHVLQVGILAARGTDVLNNALPDGGSSNNTDYATVGDTLASGITAAAQRLDENWVPDEDRYCYLKPAQFYLLQQTTKLLNKDWGGEGSLAAGTLPRITNVQLVKTNNFPAGSDVAAITGERNTYAVDAQNTVALVTHRSSVGTLRRMGVSTDAGWERMVQSWVLIAKYAMGHGILRPEAAFELRTADPA